jgi:O-antigen ligase
MVRRPVIHHSAPRAGRSRGHLLVTPLRTARTACTTEQLLFFGLLLAVSISPRLNIGSLTFEKTVDLRVEDVIVLATVIVAVARPRPLCLPRWFLVLLVSYLFACVCSTIVGILRDSVEPVRASLFLGKEIEILVLPLLVARFAGAPPQVNGAVLGAATGAVVNIGYILYQYATGRYAGLEKGYYGVALVGEGTAYTVSAYSVLLILAGLVLASRQKWGRTAFALLLCVGGTMGTLGGMSRTSVVGLSLAMAAWVVFSCSAERSLRPLRDGLAVGTVVVPVAIFTFQLLASYQEAHLAVNRVPDFFSKQDAFDAYRRERIDDVYAEFYSAIDSSPIIGLGMSITGTALPNETHNHYLRLIAETGLIGLVLFTSLIGGCLIASFRIARSNACPRTRNLALLTYLFSVFMLTTAWAQDCFVAIRLVELYWILAALTLRSRRMSTAHGF